jgi:VanZ family protein
MKPFLRYYLPALLWAALIFTISSIPRLTPPPVGLKLSDKVYHFIEFAILGLLLMRALSHYHGSAGWPAAFRRAVLLGILWGVLDEFHQLFVAGREASLLDVLADAIGVLAAAGAAWWWLKKRSAREMKKPRPPDRRRNS